MEKILKKVNLMKIFHPNKYGYYLKDSFDIALQEAENYFLSDQWDADTSHQGGWEEFKTKVKETVDSARLKAAKAFGLNDKITISSILNKLRGLLSKVINFIREKAKEWAPRIKALLDRLCNYIMDGIDYIKMEFS